MSGMATAPRKYLQRNGSPVARHVLIAAPESASASGPAAQLREAGARVSLAHTIFATLVKATCHLPDVILLDLSLGAADAAEAARLLTTCPLTAHIPIVRLSARRPVPQRILISLRKELLRSGQSGAAIAAAG